jgi:hypothetical protein
VTVTSSPYGNGSFGVVPCDEPFSLTVTIPAISPSSSGTEYAFALSPDVSRRGGTLSACW